MKLWMMIVGVVALTACQPKVDSKTDSKIATAVTNSNAPICEQYASFVEAYANKQADDVKATLLKRLAYDKQNWVKIGQQEADAYCKQSLERMQKMAGS